MNNYSQFHIEDFLQCLDMKCNNTNIPFWSLIRTQFIRAIITHLYYENLNSVFFKKKISYFNVASYLTKSLFSNYQNKNLTADFCFMTGDLGLYLDNGVYTNRLSDYFISECPSPVINLEITNSWEWFKKRKFSRNYFLSPYQINLGIFRKFYLNKSIKNLSSEIIYNASDITKDKYGIKLDDKILQRLSIILAKKVSTLEMEYSKYIKEFERRKIKFLFKEDGCYSSSVIPISAANLNGIKTIEFQHGLITKTHEAYNLPLSIINNNNYKNIYPQYFLSYGKWWNTQISIPSKIVTIGNPHFSENQNQNQNQNNKHNNMILFLGDGLDTNKHLNFVQKIFSRCRSLGYDVVFRPHPIEKKINQEKYPFKIDYNENLNSSLSKTLILVGEQSTSLFEACSYVDYIFVWDTPKSNYFLPENPFLRFKDELEFINTIKNLKKLKIKKTNSNDFFDKNWKLNFTKFVNNLYN